MITQLHATRARLTVQVSGVPIPQGSKGARAIKGRPQLFDTNAAKLAPWRKAVHDAAVDATRYHDTITGPVRVWLRFAFERPTSHYRTGRFGHLLRDDAPHYPIGPAYGDADKLTRAVFDSLTTAGVWTDDRLVVDLRSRKFYAGEHELAPAVPGVDIIIEEVTD